MHLLLRILRELRVAIYVSLVLVPASKLIESLLSRPSLEAAADFQSDLYDAVAAYNPLRIAQPFFDTLLREWKLALDLWDEIWTIPLLLMRFAWSPVAGLISSIEATYLTGGLTMVLGFGQLLMGFALAMLVMRRQTFDGLFPVVLTALLTILLGSLSALLIQLFMVFGFVVLGSVFELGAAACGMGGIFGLAWSVGVNYVQHRTGGALGKALNLEGAPASVPAAAAPGETGEASPGASADAPAGRAHPGG